MDLSVFLEQDFDSVIAVRAIKNLAANRNKNVVLLRVFLGATRQEEPFKRGIAEAQSILREQNIQLQMEIFGQDYVKNEKHWTVTQLIDWLLASDVHLVPCHIHEGNLNKTPSWNVDNIMDQVRRLKYHLGLPMGKHVDCAVWNGNKFVLSESSEGFSAPSMQIPLRSGILNSRRLREDIKQFIKKITSDPVFHNNNQFMLKLGFCCGGQHQGKRISCKIARGLKGILKRIQEWLNNSTVLNVVPYCILQPLIRDNTEAKVICFNGKFISRNPHKHGTSYGHQSTLGKDDSKLGAIAEGMIARLKAAHPQLIADQILRVDFFRDTKSGQYILNEVECFNAQIVGIRGGEGAGTVMDMVQNYWKTKTLELVNYYLAN